MASIVVIDDEAIWHRLLKKLLGDLGYTVHTAATKDEGLRLLKTLKPDCLLLDYHLGETNACEVCRALRMGEFFGKTPIIVFSSDPGVEMLAYDKCGAARFVLKGPTIIADLPGVIKDVLSRREPGKVKGQS